jgi:ABC-type lipoprotein export system ATPase subunit
MHVSVDGITFGFSPGSPLAHDLSFTVETGQVCAIVGPSGTGKSSLLGVISGIVTPWAGSVSVDAVAGRPRFCWITQSYNSLPQRSVLDNTALAALAAGCHRAAADEVALRSLRQVGLEHLSGHAANTLSGGELQRVAVARALASESGVLLADEPTGNLDRRNSEMVIATIIDAARSGRAVIVATHDMSFRDAADIVVDLAEVRHVAHS